MHYHLGKNVTLEDCLRIILNNEVEEFLSVNRYQKYKKDIEEAQGLLSRVKQEIKQEWDKVKEIKEQKDFASKISKHPMKKILFRLRKDSTNNNNNNNVEDSLKDHYTLGLLTELISKRKQIVAI